LKNKYDEEDFTAFKNLNDIVKKLRNPDGCDWDRSQNENSLIPYFIEEVYELIDGIDKKDSNNIREELGDVLLHIVFQSQIASEKNFFTIYDVINEINKKLIDRHPHVFKKNNDNNLISEQFWEKNKQINKKRESRLDGIPKILPSLISAQRIQEKASTVGFEWDNINQVWEKLDEEIEEVKTAQKENDFNKIENELGDLLFTIINLCRFFNVSGENALRKANKKFKTRFHLMERHAFKLGKEIEDIPMNELNEIWDLIKNS
jgi:tetrapyrrole methylase family protein/MazG family protein